MSHLQSFKAMLEDAGIEYTQDEINGQIVIRVWKSSEGYHPVATVKAGFDKITGELLCI